MAWEPPHERHRSRHGSCIATHNAGKLAEMRELLAPFGIEAVSAGELGLPEPDETGTMFAENAAIKARAAATASGLPAFADDSGLCVDALDGAPGLFSARWAGPAKDFSGAMARIAAELDTARRDRPGAAHFVSALVLAWPDGHDETLRGPGLRRPRCRRAARAASATTRCSSPTATTAPSARCSSEEKHGVDWQTGNALSHRARAFVPLAADLPAAP